MVLVYLPTWLGHLWGKCWCAYTSTMDPMDPMGYSAGWLLNRPLLQDSRPLTLPTGRRMAFCDLDRSEEPMEKNTQPSQQMNQWEHKTNLSGGYDFNHQKWWFKQLPWWFIYSKFGSVGVLTLLAIDKSQILLRKPPFLMVKIKILND